MTKTQKTTKEKNKGGRPSIKLTEKQIHQIESLAAFGHTQKNICNYLDIKDRTFREIKNRDALVATAYETGRMNATNKVVERLWEHIEDKNNVAVSFNATKFFLEAQSNWSTKQVIETKDTTRQLRPLDIKKRVKKACKKK